MYNIYLTRAFFDRVKEIELEAWSRRDAQVIYLLKVFSDLLCSGSNVYFDIPLIVIEDIFNSSSKGFSEDLASQIVYNLVKSNKLVTKCNIEKLDYIGLYFSEQSKNKPFNNGVFSLSDPSQLVDFNMWNHSIKLTGPSTYKGVLHPPVNSLIYIDPYLFRKNKLINFESFLDSFDYHKLSIQFHLTIYSSIEETSQKDLDLFLNLLDSILKIEYEIILVNKRSITSDRIFISNYTIGTMTHPFDRDNHLHSNFLPIQKENEKKNGEVIDYVKKIVRNSHYNSEQKNDVLNVYKCIRSTENFRNRLIDVLIDNKV